MHRMANTNDINLINGMSVCDGLKRKGFDGMGEARSVLIEVTRLLLGRCGIKFDRRGVEGGDGCDGEGMYG